MGAYCPLVLFHKKTRAIYMTRAKSHQRSRTNVVLLPTKKGAYSNVNHRKCCCLRDPVKKNIV